MNDPIASHLAQVRARLDAACAAAGRHPGAVRLLAVSKTRPAADVLAAARAVVIGSVAAVLASVLGVLALIFGIRLSNEALDALGLSREVAVWLTYAIFGTVFVLVGLLLWRKRAPVAA